MFFSRFFVFFKNRAIRSLFFWFFYAISKQINIVHLDPYSLNLSNQDPMKLQTGNIFGENMYESNQKKVIIKKHVCLLEIPLCLTAHLALYIY